VLSTGWQIFLKKVLARFSTPCLNANALQYWRRHFNPARATKIAAAIFCVALVFALALLASCPSLHQLIHKDADDPDHECAVTLFSHGQVDASPAAAPVFCAPERLIFSQSLPRIIFVSTDIRLLPGRGPPASPALV
jgi:hypothetical protein